MQQTAQTPATAQPARPTRPVRAAQEAAAPQRSGAELLVEQMRNDAALTRLRIQRGEVNDQIRQLTERRNELNSQRQSMSAEAGRGHDERIRVIDERSAQLERRLLQLDEEIARGVPGVSSEQGGGGGGGGGASGRDVAGTTIDPDLLREIRRAASSGGEDGAVGAVAGTFTFLAFAFLFYKGVRRWLWKPRAQAVSSGMTDQAAQIAQLQRSMDVVAVEVERIAEAQRYVAKMLNERALSAGEAQPVHSRGGVNADPVERR